MMRRFLVPATGVLILGGIAVGVPATPAAAVTSLTWTGAESTAWSDSRNWSPQQVPVPGDAVTIDSGFNELVEGVPDISLSSLTIGPDMAVTSPGSTITAPTVALDGATITGTSIVATTELVVRQTVPTEPLRMYDDETPNGQEALVSNGTMRTIGSPTVELYFDADIVNNGTWIVQPESPGDTTFIDVNRCCTAPSRIVNNGTITESGGTGTLVVDRGAFIHQGAGSVLDVRTELIGGDNRVGNGAAITAGTLVDQTAGGTLRGDGTLVVGDGARVTVRERSTIRGTSDFVVGGRGGVVWNSGYLVGHMEIGPSALLVLENRAGEVDPFRRMDTTGIDTVLVNRGRVVQRADLLLWGLSDDAAVVRNIGTWTLQRGSILDFGGSEVQNTGTFTAAGATANTTVRVEGDTVTTSGTMRVTGGRLLVVPGTRFRVTNGNLDVATSVLRVEGDYAQSAAGRLTVTVRSSSAGRLQVEGTAALDGTLGVRTSGPLPASGTSRNVVTSSRRVGTFDAVRGASASQFRLSYTSRAAVLTAR